MRPHPLIRTIGWFVEVDYTLVRVPWSRPSKCMCTIGGLGLTSDDIGGRGHVDLSHHTTQRVAIVMREGGVNLDGVV